MESQEYTVIKNINEIDFHPLLKDIENMFWFFLIFTRALSDYDVQNILREKDSRQEEYQIFVQILDKFNKSTNLKIKKKGNSATSKLNVLKEMIFVGKAMTIFAYEVLSASDYFLQIEETEEFKFLKHIRNGAAHNNRFDFKYQYGSKKGQWMIDEDEVVRWGNMEISRQLQGKNVFNDFISIFGVFFLMKDFSENLKKIDNERR
ncbi:MAG: hypothetical protein PHO28_04590 [Candidatus Pacebacteria bacterium]|nr:hypothetical protein [Candidatus Paceibacterota bacterium]